MGFSRQEYWSGLPCPPLGDLPNTRIEPMSPALQVDSLTSESPGKPKNTGVGSLSLLQGIFRPRNLPGVSCIAGGFFTCWATRETRCILGRNQETLWALSLHLVVKSKNAVIISNSIFYAKKCCKTCLVFFFFVLSVQWNFEQLMENEFDNSGNKNKAQSDD